MRESSAQPNRRKPSIIRWALGLRCVKVFKKVSLFAHVSRL
jgi:hypothetical protein